MGLDFAHHSHQPIPVHAVMKCGCDERRSVTSRSDMPSYRDAHQFSLVNIIRINKNIILTFFLVFEVDEIHG